MPEKIVINKEISNPMFTISPQVLLRVYFPLPIALKYFLLKFKCNIIKNNKLIPAISWIRIGKLRNSNTITKTINISTMTLFIISLINTISFKFIINSYNKF